MRQSLGDAMSAKSFNSKDILVWQFFFRIFENTHYPFVFCNGVQHVQAKLGSAVTKASGLPALGSSSTLGAQGFLHDLFLVNTDTVSRKLGCTQTYMEKTAIIYKMQTITKTLIETAKTVKMKSLFKIFPSCPVFCRTRNVFEVHRRSKDNVTQHSQADDIGQIFDPVRQKKIWQLRCRNYQQPSKNQCDVCCSSNVFEAWAKNKNTFSQCSQVGIIGYVSDSVTEKEEQAAEVWKQSAAVGDAGRCMMFLYLKYFICALTILDVWKCTGMVSLRYRPATIIQAWYYTSIIQGPLWHCNNLTTEQILG